MMGALSSILISILSTNMVSVLPNVQMVFLEAEFLEDVLTHLETKALEDSKVAIHNLRGQLDANRSRISKLSSDYYPYQSGIKTQDTASKRLRTEIDYHRRSYDRILSRMDEIQARAREAENRLVSIQNMQLARKNCAASKSMRPTFAARVARSAASSSQSPTSASEAEGERPTTQPSFILFSQKFSSGLK